MLNRYLGIIALLAMLSASPTTLLAQTAETDENVKVHMNTVFQRFNSQNEVIGTYESLYIVTRDAQGKWGTQARSSLAP